MKIYLLHHENDREAALRITNLVPTLGITPLVIGDFGAELQRSADSVIVLMTTQANTVEIVTIVYRLDTSGKSFLLLLQEGNPWPELAGFRYVDVRNLSGTTYEEAVLDAIRQVTLQAPPLEEKTSTSIPPADEAEPEPLEDLLRQGEFEVPDLDDGFEEPPAPPKAESPTVDPRGGTPEEVDPLTEWLAGIARGQDADAANKPGSMPPVRTSEEAEEAVPPPVPAGPPPAAPPPPAQAIPPYAPPPQPQARPERSRTESQTTIGGAFGLGVEQFKKQVENPVFSAFYPQLAAPNATYALMVFAHIEAALDQVRSIAAGYAPQMGGTPKHASEASRFAVKSGALLTFVPHVNGLSFTPERQVITWDALQTGAAYKEAVFLFQTPSVVQSNFEGRVMVFDGPLLIGEIAVQIAAGAGSATQEANMRRFDPIFASYSHRDTPVMEYFRRIRGALGQKMLVDIYDLRAGDHWADKLLQMIDQSSVFQLFWSRYSAESKYCQQEWQHALRYLEQRENFVQPVFWTREPSPTPPPELARLHFEKVTLPPVTLFKTFTRRLRDTFR
jgi:hypothetical protein